MSATPSSSVCCTPVPEEDLDFGSYGYIKSMFGFNFKKQLSKCAFYKSSNVADQKAMADLLENITKVYFAISEKLALKLNELKWNGGDMGDDAAKRTYIEDASRKFKNRMATILQSLHNRT